MTNITMENHHFSWENSLQMVIPNSYVKLPEGRDKQKKYPNSTFFEPARYCILGRSSARPSLASRKF